MSTQCVSTTCRRVGGGMLHDWWRWEVRTLVMPVKWRVGARDPRKNVDLALKKPDLRT
jgi:hypothetical protein